MRARFLFPLMVHISRCKSQNVAPPIIRRYEGLDESHTPWNRITNLILKLFSHLEFCQRLKLRKDQDNLLHLIPFAHKGGPVGDWPLFVIDWICLKYHSLSNC
jgi:hypothetical protein